MDCGHVYRFGGDEFVMLFPAGMENRIEEIAEAILQKIAEAGIANGHLGCAAESYHLPGVCLLCAGGHRERSTSD